jgi:L-fucose mutarotase
MGHGDTICIADANFPAHSVAKANNARLISMEGVRDIPVLLEAILKHLPLDTYAAPVMCMDLVPSDAARGLEVPAWGIYGRIASDAEGREVAVSMIERFAFYEEAKRAFAVITSSDGALYANVILRKGVLPFQK